MVVSTRSQGRSKCLVTGGLGFLGQHLVKQLVESGKYDVTVFDIRDATVPGATVIKGDLRDLDQVTKAVDGCYVVFHCATATPTGENALNIKLMHSVNVLGTQHIITACQKAGVKKLVYTSSSSVVFEGKHCNNVDETFPYATKPLDYYTQTKIEGEKLALAANGVGGVASTALRPAGIFGDGDPLFLPTVIERAKKGKMKFMIGNGRNMMDFTYVGNVAAAHLQAADALALDSKLAGQAYFITNKEPRPFWGMIGDLCQGLGYERPHIKLPALLILLIAALVENLIMPLVRPFKEIKSDFTVNRIKISTVNRVFNADRASKDFGYTPLLSMDQAIKKTVESFGHLRAPAGGVQKKGGAGKVLVLLALLVLVLALVYQQYVKVPAV